MKTKIKSLGVDYYIIKGDKNIRVNNVKTIINNIINSKIFLHLQNNSKGGALKAEIIPISDYDVRK